MTVDEILSRLDKVKRHTDPKGVVYWTARCTAHPDDSPSLSISEGRDGAVLLKCHAGCTNEAIVAALGLELRDLFPSREEAPETAYDYLDAEGSALYRVKRKQFPNGGKTFWQQRPDGRGGWIDGRDGIPTVLYRADKLAAALKAGTIGVVYIVEGEKDVHAAERAGVLATTSPGGATNWTEARYAEQLCGFERAIIVADRDEAGRRHAHQVAAAIAEAVLDVEIVQAAVGKDLSDHLAAGKTLDELEPFDDEPGLPEADADASAATPKQHNGPEVATERRALEGITHADALKTELDDGISRHLVEDTVERGTVGTVAGIPETHKTFIAQRIAVGVASGDGEILGRKVTAQGNVGYFWQDDSRRNELERIQLFETVRATAPDIPLRWFLNEGLQLPDDLLTVRATIEHHGFVLAVFDSFYNFAGGIDLKDKEAARLVGQIKSEIADPTGCTILIVDHSPWQSDSNRGQMRAYGDVHKGAAVRWGIYLAREGKKIFVEIRGNNIRGLRRAPAEWNDDTLELRLIDVADAEDHETTVANRAEIVLAWLTDHPAQHSTTAIRKAVGGRESVTDEALEALKARADVLALIHRWVGGLRPVCVEE